MLDIDFSLDGISARSMGIILQKNITFGSAEPKVESINVPGRNGTLHIYDGSFENVSGEAECYALGLLETNNNVSAALNRINTFLSGTSGYRKLEYSYEPGFYRMARVKGSAGYDARLNRVAPFKISFDCMPQIFYSNGDTAVSVSKGQTIHNYTGFASKPLIKVTGSGSATLTVNGNVMTISAITDYLMIDSEIQDAYKGAENKNSTVSGEFPDLAPGDNTITWTGSITAVEITPRWWTI